MKRIIILIFLIVLGTRSIAQVPAVPSSVTFAGEKISLERQDLYERMDRELITFTYSHTNTTLILRRAERIFTQVVPILLKEGVPEDLKYLMTIESNLDPKALSVAGAAGLWQFTKSTAKEYGLEVTAEVDERYNIEKETVAACAYLKKAYEKYGNWMTVAASYNAGQNGITRRIADQKQTHAFDLWMAEETSRYMFRILTAKMLFDKPQAFGFGGGAVISYPYTAPKEVVEVSSSITSLVDFAEKHGVTYAALKGANLWLRDSKLTVHPGKNYQIIIPDTTRGKASNASR